ncbi:MAG: creatininase family protein [Planctomycetes bacterium]|nr:creatininase family protein [Planctomycetota bacterium]
MSNQRVRFSDLLPHQFRARLKQRPLAYLPLGTLEWHGEHLPLGSDAIISEGLFVRAAQRFGGIVMPPIHLGPDRQKTTPDGVVLQGMEYHESTTPHRPLDGSCYWIGPGAFNALLDAILEQLKRAGFKAVFADGHGPSRNHWRQGLAERQERFGLKLLGVTEDTVKEWRSQTDHAAKNETSLVMALRPELPDLAQLGADRSVWPQGVGGPDPRDASAAFGEECLEATLQLMRKKLDEAGV